MEPAVAASTDWTADAQQRCLFEAGNDIALGLEPDDFNPWAEEETLVSMGFGMLSAG